MTILNQLTERAKQNPAKLVLCESTDARILQAALRAQQQGIAEITLVGDPAAIKEAADKLELDINQLSIEDPQQSPHREELVKQLVAKRQSKGMTEELAQTAINEPLTFATMMVHSGLVEGIVAGAVYSTADVVRNVLQLIGKREDTKVVSSFFLMLFNQPHHPIQGSVLFSDCALMIAPNSEELAEIAKSTINSAKGLLDEEPRVAMLSFSTACSAEHPEVTKVIEAARMVKAAMPDIAIDEDVQFDAAIIPDIAKRKQPNSQVQGRSNVFIFPSLNAGNIGYKIAERLGGAVAIGPILQGLKRPANDLSRGCSIDDIFYAMVITALQAKQEG